MIYNNLKSKIDIISFLKDGGKITVKYNKVATVVDLYDITNVVEIECNFNGVVTYMNKFYFYNMIDFVAGNKVEIIENTTCVEYIAKTTFNNFDMVVENAIATMNSIVYQLENSKQQLKKCENVITVGETLNGYSKMTDKAFNDCLQIKEEIMDVLGINLDFNWYTKDDMKQLLKDGKKRFNEYFDINNENEIIDLISDNIKRFEISLGIA